MQIQKLWVVQPPKCVVICEVGLHMYCISKEICIVFVFSDGKFQKKLYIQTK